VSTFVSLPIRSPLHFWQCFLNGISFRLAQIVVFWYVKAPRFVFGIFAKKQKLYISFVSTFVSFPIRSPLHFWQCFLNGISFRLAQIVVFWYVKDPQFVFGIFAKKQKLYISFVSTFVSFPIRSPLHFWQCFLNGISFIFAQIVFFWYVKDPRFVFGIFAKKQKLYISFVSNFVSFPIRSPLYFWQCFLNGISFRFAQIVVFLIYKGS
jgi:lipoate-protein ligase A